MCDTRTPNKLAPISVKTEPRRIKFHNSTCETHTWTPVPVQLNAEAYIIFSIWGIIPWLVQFTFHIYSKCIYNITKQCLPKHTPQKYPTFPIIHPTTYISGIVFSAGLHPAWFLLDPWHTGSGGPGHKDLGVKPPPYLKIFKENPTNSDN